MKNIVLKNKLLLSNSIWKIALLLITLFFGINHFLEFALDTYATFTDTSVWQYMIFENGRIINGLVYWLFYTFSVSDTTAYFISYISALIFAYLSILLYSFAINSFLQNDLLSVLLSFFIILNPFSIEYFLFIEKGLFFFSIFCSILAVLFTRKFFLKKQNKYLLFSLMLLIIVVLCYQIHVGLFAICVFPFCVENCNCKKDFFVFQIIIGLLYGFSLGCSYILTNFILHSSRVNQSISPLRLLLPTLKSIIALTKDSFFHLPNNYLLICYGLVFIVFSLVLFIVKHRFLCLCYFIYTCIYVLCIAFFPALSGISSDLSCRIIYPYGTIWGILLIILLLFLIQEKSYSKVENHEYMTKIQQLIILISFFFLFTEYLLFQQVFLDRYKTNQTDKYICQMIGERIKEYEETSHNTITTICFYKDQSLTWGIDGAYQNGLILRAHSVGWSNLASINYYLNKEYINGTPAEHYINLFQQKNWDFFSDDQLYFEGTTLHYCVY